jgi:hypothetical protein
MGTSAVEVEVEVEVKTTSPADGVVQVDTKWQVFMWSLLGFSVVVSMLSTAGNAE